MQPRGEINRTAVSTHQARLEDHIHHNKTTLEYQAGRAAISKITLALSAQLAMTLP